MTIKILIATVFLLMPSLQNSSCEEICLTKVCVETASRIRQSMDKRIKPCNDFFEFACKGWIRKNPIPSNAGERDPMTVIQDKVEKKLHKILITPNKRSDGRPMKLARALYKTCMDQKSIKRLGLKPMYDTFRKIDLPLKPPSNTEARKLNIPKIVGMAARYFAIDIFIDMYIEEDMKDNTKNRLKIEQTAPSFDVVETYRRDPEQFKGAVDAQRRYIKKIMKLTGAGGKSGEYADELVAFMIDISKIMVAPEVRESAPYKANDMTINKLQQSTDHSSRRWSWMTYLKSAFDKTNVVVNSRNDTAVIYDMNYFKRLPILLGKTLPGIIARYVWWEVFSSLAPQAKHKFRELHANYWKSVYGITSGSPRWQGCTKMVNSIFGMALTAAYVEKHFDVEEKQKALEMWTDVSKSFHEMLTEIKWMDTATKAQAHRKLSAMRPFIGYPEWVLNAEMLDKYYEEYEVFEGKFFDTYLHYISTSGKKVLNSWRQKPDRNSWITSGTKVNAFYSTTGNSVTIPAAILHKPLYGNGVEAVNYGAIGAIMGHELTHGFDNQGRQFDGRGNLRQWWTKETLKLYLKKVDCMIKQYSAYKVTQLGKNWRVNGVITQGENIADNGGLREAYRAFKKLSAKSEQRENELASLPGLVKYTNEQLFFLGFAQMWCGRETDFHLKTRLLDDEHPPNRFRVIGTLQNNADFARAWKCPRGSPMNPKNKCIVW